MRKSGIALDKYWVTHRGYFRPATAVALGMVITYGRLLLCHGISYGCVDKKIQQDSTTAVRFMTGSMIPYQMIVVANI